MSAKANGVTLVRLHDCPGSLTLKVPEIGIVVFAKSADPVGADSTGSLLFALYSLIFQYDTAWRKHFWEFRKCKFCRLSFGAFTVDVLLFE